MTESWTGNPAPLLSNVSVGPVVEVMSTLKDDIDVSDGKVAKNE